MPRVYLMDSPQPNAFATGRNPQHAAVCATTGLLSTLSRDEVAGVIGHELGHVGNHDTLTMTITATIAGAISMLAQFGMFFGGRRDNDSGLGVVGSLLMLVLAPLAAMIVQMAISRTREYAPAGTKSARRKATRRTAASRTPKKRPVKAGPKGAGAKKRARKRMPPVKPPGVPTAETVIIDVIEEPVPGVITVTEFEATEVREASPDSEQQDES